MARPPPYFAKRPKWHRRLILQQASTSPALAANVASQRIQSLWRGYASRRRRRSAVIHPPQLSAFDLRFLAFVATHKLEPSAGSLLLLACLRLQSWWRMQLLRRRAKRLLFAAFSRTAHSFARSIQAWYRSARRLRRLRRRKPRSKPYAAWLIQRAWTRHVDRRTYRYFRDLLAFRNAGEPVTMLKSIVPKETELLDPAVGARVRFRLGGNHPVWPPAILFRVYVTAPLCDVNSFAPREYHQLAPVRPRPPLQPQFLHGRCSDRLGGPGKRDSPHAPLPLSVEARGVSMGACDSPLVSASAKGAGRLTASSSLQAGAVVGLPPTPHLRRGGGNGTESESPVFGQPLPAASVQSPKPELVERVAKLRDLQSPKSAASVCHQDSRTIEDQPMGIRVGRSVFGVRLGASLDTSEVSGLSCGAVQRDGRLPHLSRTPAHAASVQSSRAAAVKLEGASLVLFSTTPELLELSALPRLVSRRRPGPSQQANQLQRAQSTANPLLAPPALCATTVDRTLASAVVGELNRVSDKVLLQSSDDFTPAGWYRRDSVALNDWRPVSLAQVEAADGIDPALKLRKALAVTYRPPRAAGPTLVQARSEAKQRRRKWLLAMYERGCNAAKAAEDAAEAAAAAAKEAALTAATTFLGLPGPKDTLGQSVQPLGLQSVGLLLEAALVAGAAQDAAEARTARIPQATAEDTGFSESGGSNEGLFHLPALAGRNVSELRRVYSASSMPLDGLSSASLSASMTSAEHVLLDQEQQKADPRVQRAYDVAGHSAGSLLQAQADAYARRKKALADAAVVRTSPTADGLNVYTFDSYVSSWRALGTSLRPTPSPPAAVSAVYRL